MKQHQLTIPKINPAEKTIINEEQLTKHQKYYWNRVKEVKNVHIIDPWRTPLRELRQKYPSKLVYRASSGGKWGKSSEIVLL